MRTIRGISMSTSTIATRAKRIRAKLETKLQAASLVIDDVSWQHAGHSAMRGNTSGETHFNLKIVSPLFEGCNLVKRHRMVYDLLSDEFTSGGLHALSITANTPTEVAPK